ncbi:hypothetical protein AX17_006669 [Amanita inopinata Kibby_2008]|nr:hypothetical protein AX17_006669 [Amanita inopinata Kibby_2008]
MQRLVFYDLASNLKTTALSPNAWKARYVLNYKTLPYKTEWVEFPDIESKCKEIGVGPTVTRRNGTPLYTIPAIYDPNTKAAISDSYQITRYLDKTYPQTPSIIPKGTEVFQSFPLFFHALGPNTTLWNFAVPATYAALNPTSQEFFRRTREEWYKKKIEDMEPKGAAEAEAAWNVLKQGYNKLDRAWQLSEGLAGPYVMGNTLSFTDITVVSWTLWLRNIFGKDSQRWKDITDWNDGRWGRLVESLAKYEVIN